MSEYEQKLRAGDVGTRLQHMLELRELWATAYEITTRAGMWHSNLDEARASTLKPALELLNNHITAEYSDDKDRRDINSIPNAEFIPNTPRSQQ